MKTKLTTQPSSLLADGSLQLHAPHSWAELSQDQLRYVLTLLTQGWQEWQVRTYLFARLTGVQVLNYKKDGWLCETTTDQGKTIRFFLQLWQVQSFCECFDFVFDGQGADNRLDQIGPYKAVDVELHGFPFINYIVCDNYFQQFLESDQTSDQPLREMARVLYLNSEGVEPDSIQCSPADLMGVFLWFTFVKNNFSKAFPHLFKPANGVTAYDPTETMNAQIRALTGGDITKEQTIKKADVWRALTELDAKAREADELNNKLKKS